MTDRAVRGSEIERRAVTGTSDGVSLVGSTFGTTMMPCNSAMRCVCMGVGDTAVYFDTYILRT